MIDKDERVSLIKVVEYLEPTMAKELLCKFPHSCTFDFDYTQSSIWSPVAPRAFKSLPPLEMDRVLRFINSDEEEEKKKAASTPPSLKQRKRLYGIGLANKKTLKRVSENNALNLSFVSNFQKKIKSASVAGTLKSSKGWDVVLKAASKRFKKRKKKDQIAHVKLSNNIINNGIL